jgi:Holliday junction resolvasome RuvABC endonuclease subunit
MKLSLDLGTHMGWATSYPGMVESGTWHFDTKRSVDSSWRFRSFRDKLNELHQQQAGIEIIYYEEVKSHAGTTAAHIYGGFVAILIAWCGDRDVAYESVPVGTIKKYWTGKGNADKEMMIAEAKRRGFNPGDDNEADALALLHYNISPNSAAVIAEKPKRASKSRKKNGNQSISGTGSDQRERQIGAGGDRVIPGNDSGSTPERQAAGVADASYYHNFRRACRDPDERGSAVEPLTIGRGTVSAKVRKGPAKG